MNVSWLRLYVTGGLKNPKSMYQVWVDTHADNDVIAKYKLRLDAMPNRVHIVQADRKKPIPISEWFKTSMTRPLIRRSLKELTDLDRELERLYVKIHALKDAPSSSMECVTEIIDNVNQFIDVLNRDTSYLVHLLKLFVLVVATRSDEGPNSVLQLSFYFKYNNECFSVPVPSDVYDLLVRSPMDDDAVAKALLNMGVWGYQFLNVTSEDVKLAEVYDEYVADLGDEFTPFEHEEVLDVRYLTPCDEVIANDHFYPFNTSKTVNEARPHNRNARFTLYGVPGEVPDLLLGRLDQETRLGPRRVPLMNKEE